MIKDYKYLGFTKDSRLSFIRYVVDTKHKVDSRFNMIKAMTNPWLEPPIQVIIQNHTQKKVDPEGAAIEASNITAYLKESRTLTINIYTDASSQDNRTTTWACFIK